MCLQRQNSNFSIHIFLFFRGIKSIFGGENVDSVCGCNFFRGLDRFWPFLQPQTRFLKKLTRGKASCICTHSELVKPLWETFPASAAFHGAVGCFSYIIRCFPYIVRCFSYIVRCFSYIVRCFSYIVRATVISSAGWWFHMGDEFHVQ